MQIHWRSSWDNRWKGQFGYQLWFDHTCSGYAYEDVQTRQFVNDHCENSNCRDCAKEASCMDTRIGTCICWFVCDSVRRFYCTESSWIRVLYEIVSWFMIYIICDSGVFIFKLSVKLLCYVLLIFHFVHCGCDRGLIFYKNNSRSDYVFNSGV